MAMKKAKPMVAQRRADRKAFVEKTAGMASTPKSKQAARQKFFVQTRIKEMEAKGQTVDAAKRKELRKKFQSGNVSRAGFGAPKKRAASMTSSFHRNGKAFKSKTRILFIRKRKECFAGY
jgi:hypothetical protein